MNYDQQPGAHDTLVIGSVRLHWHDYDGPYLVIVSDGKQASIHAKKLEKLLIKYLKENQE